MLETVETILNKKSGSQRMSMINNSIESRYVQDRTPCKESASSRVTILQGSSILMIGAVTVTKATPTVIPD